MDLDKLLDKIAIKSMSQAQEATAARDKAQGDLDSLEERIHGPGAAASIKMDRVGLQRQIERHERRSTILMRRAACASGNDSVGFPGFPGGPDESGDPDYMQDYGAAWPLAVREGRLRTPEPLPDEEAE